MVYRAKDAEVISTNTRGKPLIASTLYLYWLRKLKRLGLVKPGEPEYSGNRYGKNLSRARKKINKNILLFLKLKF